MPDQQCPMGHRSGMLLSDEACQHNIFELPSNKYRDCTFLLTGFHEEDFLIQQQKLNALMAQSLKYPPYFLKVMNQLLLSLESLFPQPLKLRMGP